MKKVLNIFLIIFSGLTLLLVVTHLEKVDYYLNSQTRESRIEVYNKNFKLSSYFKPDYSGNLRVDLSFHHINTDFEILDIVVKLNQLNLNKIKPYHGMKTWDNPTYENFSSIPDSLKYLSQESNPYYAFDHYFETGTDKDTYSLKITANISEKGKILNLTKDVEIVRDSKIELRPWDAHSDLSLIHI